MSMKMPSEVTNIRRSLSSSHTESIKDKPLRCVDLGNNVAFPQHQAKFFIFGVFLSIQQCCSPVCEEN